MTDPQPQPIAFKFLTCSDCGIHYGIPAHWRRARQEDGRVFFCPNGHGQSYKETTLDDLRNELEKTYSKLALAKAELAARRGEDGDPEPWTPLD